MSQVSQLPRSAELRRGGEHEAQAPGESASLSCGAECRSDERRVCDDGEVNRWVEVEALEAPNGELQEQIRLLERLVAISDEAHRETKKQVEHWKHLHGLASSTATLYEDLYRGSESRGWAAGLVVAITAAVAGAAGYLLALAQVGAFVR